MRCIIRGSRKYHILRICCRRSLSFVFLVVNGCPCPKLKFTKIKLPGALKILHHPVPSHKSNPKTNHTISKLKKIIQTKNNSKLSNSTRNFSEMLKAKKNNILLILKNTWLKSLLNQWLYSQSNRNCIIGNPLFLNLLDNIDNNHACSLQIIGKIV